MNRLSKCYKISGVELGSAKRSFFRCWAARQEVADVIRLPTISVNSVMHMEVKRKCESFLKMILYLNHDACIFSMYFLDL